jgi:electron transfer flavoprotein beta subunit
MKVLVFLKQTFDMEEKIVVQDNKIRDAESLIMNPYDEFALEEAIRVVEKHGGEVTAATIGTAKSESMLRTALAMGADKSILVNIECAYMDEYTIPKVLAAISKREDFDLILCGNMTIDGGSSQTGPRLAEELNIPHVAAATRLEISGQSVKVESDVEGDKVYVETRLPVLITAQQGLNEPRYPSLPGIMKAKKKPLEILTLADLGFHAESLPNKTEVAGVFQAPPKAAGKILAGDLDAQVAQLLQLLRSEASVI